MADLLSRSYFYREKQRKTAISLQYIEKNYRMM